MQDQNHEPFAVMVDTDTAGKRLDAFVATLFPGISRNFLSHRIRLGAIMVNGSPRKSAYRLLPGDLVSGPLPETDAAPLPRPEPINLSILFEDDAIIVINKAPGMVVHPSPGHHGGTLVSALLARHPAIRSVGGNPERPGIVHRLDKDTSGALVVAKTDASHAFLSRQFKDRLVSKTYLGLVYGEMKQEGDRIVLPIGRHPENRKKMTAGKADGGRHAETHWRLLRQFHGISLLAFDIKTGRTHQIRVHSAAIQHPIVGDAVYGLKRPGRLFEGQPPMKRWVHSIHRQMLHSWQLGLAHPETGKEMRFTAPLPEDMDRAIADITALQESEGR